MAGLYWQNVRMGKMSLNLSLGKQREVRLLGRASHAGWGRPGAAACISAVLCNSDRESALGRSGGPGARTNTAVRPTGQQTPAGRGWDEMQRPGDYIWGQEKM